MRLVCIAVCAGVFLLLSACAQQTIRTHEDKNQPAPASWAAHKKQMQAITQWHMKGKIGYRSPADGGSAWVDWRQQNDEFEMFLSGPFGAGVVRIFGNKHFATLRQADVEDISTRSAAALTVKLFGWQLPVDELAYWVRGIPAPRTAVTSRAFNAEGLLDNFEQTGWHLELSRYRDTGAGKLPGKVLATHDKLRFTLVIKDLDLTADDHRQL